MERSHDKVREEMQAYMRELSMFELRYFVTIISDEIENRIMTGEPYTKAA